MRRHFSRGILIGASMLLVAQGQALASEEADEIIHWKQVAFNRSQVDPENQLTSSRLFEKYRRRVFKHYNSILTRHAGSYKKIGDHYFEWDIPWLSFLLKDIENLNNASPPSSCCFHVQLEGHTYKNLENYFDHANQILNRYLEKTNKENNGKAIAPQTYLMLRLIALNLAVKYSSDIPNGLNHVIFAALTFISPDIPPGFLGTVEGQVFKRLDFDLRPLIEIQKAPKQKSWGESCCTLL